MLPLRCAICANRNTLSQFLKSNLPVAPLSSIAVDKYYISSQSHRYPVKSLNYGSTLLQRRLQSSASQSRDGDKEKLAQLSSQMNMRLLNENSFLSWCRNAYLSSVVGIAMMEQATTSLGQSAGFGAFIIGGMNVFWGTGCHVINLIRLRQVAGMSGLVLTLNVLGSLFHCLLFLFILTCYIGFLDDPNYVKPSPKKVSNNSLSHDGDGEGNDV